MMTRQNAENILRIVAELPADLVEWQRVDALVKVGENDAGLLEALQQECNELRRDRAELRTTIELIVEAEKRKS
jgi:peptidoglycan hydrolase CwlO-like protein